MKTLVILAVLAAAAYFGYQRLQKPAELDAPIENPVYAEIRTNMKVQGQELEFGLFGKMASEKECRERSEFFWNKAIAGCADCKLSVKSCQAELPPRYARLFENVPTHSAYLSFTRGSDNERDGRMVIWGLSAAEGNAVCEQARAQIQGRNYQGRIECVAARND